MRLFYFLTILLIFSSTSSAQNESETDFEFIESSLGEVYKLGTGEKTLLLIPCASCRWRSFDEFMERNQEKYTMYAVTLPGYGGTKVPDLPMWSGEAVFQINALTALMEVIEKEQLDDIIIVGSSFGTTMGVKLASHIPEKVKGFINLDGGIGAPLHWEKWDKSTAMLEARSSISQYGLPLLDDPDAWQRFNTPAIKAREDRKLLYHGWFMATNPNLMMQYWRENFLLIENDMLRNIEFPFLDIRCIRPWDKKPEDTRSGVESFMKSLKLGNNYSLVFLYDTPHFIMEERPKLLDDIIKKFLNGEKIEDFKPAKN